MALADSNKNVNALSAHELSGFTPTLLTNNELEICNTALGKALGCIEISLSLLMNLRR